MSDSPATEALEKLILNTTTNTDNGNKDGDKFQVYGTGQNVNKGRSGRHRSSTHGESVATVLQACTQSPRKSVSSVVVRPVPLNPPFTAFCGVRSGNRTYHDC
jgi:hypothetical protein